MVEVNTVGRVVVSYSNQLKSTAQCSFNGSHHLSIEENNEYIFVADCYNNRIVILNRALFCYARELNATSVDGGRNNRHVSVLTSHRTDCLSANMAVSIVSWCLTTSFDSI